MSEKQENKLRFTETALEKARQKRSGTARYIYYEAGGKQYFVTAYKDGRVEYSVK